MTNQLIVNTIVSAAHYALVGVGFSLIFRTTRFFHFAYAGVYTIGAYSALIAVKHFNTSFTISVLTAIICAGTLGIGMEICIFRTLRKREASSLVMLLASLGLLIVLQNTVSLIFSDKTRSLGLTHGFREPLVIFGARATMLQIILILSAVIICVSFAIFLRFASLGKMIRAISSDSELAEAVGLNVDSLIVFTFGIGSGIAGLSGCLWAENSALTPFMGFQPFLYGVVAAIVGGIHSIPGVMRGALMVALAQNITMWYFPSVWKDSIVFILLLGFLLLRKRIRFAENRAW